MLTVKIVEPLQAIEWLKFGWRLFRANPVNWALMGLLFGVIVLVLSMLPFLGGVLLNMAVPLLTGGMLLAVKNAHAGKQTEIPELFSAFKDETTRYQLLMLGALMLGAGFVAAILSKLLVGDMISIDELTGMPIFNFGGSILVFVLLVSLGMGMLFTYAPALVVFNGMSALEAVKGSFQGAWANALPFVVFALLYMVLAFVASIPMMLGFLVLIPVMMGAVYASYKDIFK
ncbi:MAG: BPSS1780 family membrane protein [Thiothrix litoralis]